MPIIIGILEMRAARVAFIEAPSL